MAKKPQTAAAAKSTAVAVRATESANGLQKFDIHASGNQIPDLDQLEVAPIDLSGDYWTPENIGESRRLVFQKIADRDFIDKETGESKPLETAFFLYKEGDTVKLLTNSSKRLVAAIVNNNVEPGTPLLVTYRGKKRNSTNEKSTDRWSIKPLFINITAQSA